jgi:hypothetical protein
MRAAALGVVALAIGLGGCAALDPAPRGPSYGGAYAPLRAHIVPQMVSSSSRMNFHVNRPAHVAMFRIAPGQGTTMIFPSAGIGTASSRVFPGLHTVLPTRHWNPSASFSSSGLRRGPVFYFMIASEQPLRTAELGSYGHRLNTLLGVGFASYSAYGTMERLASLVVPDLASDSWTTDFYVEWPELDTSPRHGYVLVQCNGLSVYAPPHMARDVFEQLCRRGQQEPPQAEPVQPGDSTGVVEPIRRPPVEIGERITSTQLSDPDRLREMVEAVRRGRSVESIDRSGFGVVDRGGLDRRGTGADANRRGGLDDRPGGSRDAAPERRPARELGADGAREATGRSPAPPARERPAPTDRLEGRSGATERATPASGSAAPRPGAGATERRDPAPPPTDGGRQSGPVRAVDPV